MSPSSYLVAAAQMTSAADREKNLSTAIRLVSQAADLGAKLVGLPENFVFFGRDIDRIANAETLEGPTLSTLREVARSHRIWILAGSIAERLADPTRTANTSALISDDGSIAATYRKIHLYDANLPDGARYEESKTVVPGDQPVVCPTPLGRIGLSICYDLRFPELFRKLTDLGVEIITVPAAFTLYTGKDHWEVLLRARAIENLSYLLAPAQVGRHSANRVTYGNAMIIDPWGTVLARCPDGEGLCLASFQRERIEQVRRELPALEHRRL